MELHTTLTANTGYDCAWFDASEGRGSIDDFTSEEIDIASTTSTVQSGYSGSTVLNDIDFERTEKSINNPTSPYNSYDEWDIHNPLQQEGQFDNSEWSKELKHSQLQWQEQASDSMVARRVAGLGILVTHDVERFFVQLESEVNTKVSERRAIRLREKRHQRNVLVNTKDKLKAVLDRLDELDHWEPQVVIDCEGLNFKRTGTIDIMELYVRPDDILYLLDVVALKESTWTTTATKSNLCLHQFLSSTQCKKIMWDLRMDAHILNSLYGIRLSGIIDSSLWAIAYRRSRNRSYDNSRIKIDTMCKEVLRGKIPAEEFTSLEEAKAARLYLPPRPWAIRPLPLPLIDYTADVKYMGMLYDVFLKKLGSDPVLAGEIASFTEQELEIACDMFWDATGERDAKSPWSTGYLSTSRAVLTLNREDAATRFQSQLSMV